MTRWRFLMDRHLDADWDYDPEKDRPVFPMTDGGLGHCEFCLRDGPNPCGRCREHERQEQEAWE